MQATILSWTQRKVRTMIKTPDGEEVPVIKIYLDLVIKIEKIDELRFYTIHKKKGEIRIIDQVGDARDPSIAVSRTWKNFCQANPWIEKDILTRIKERIDGTF